MIIDRFILPRGVCPCHQSFLQYIFLRSFRYILFSLASVIARAMSPVCNYPAVDFGHPPTYRIPADGGYFTVMRIGVNNQWQESVAPINYLLHYFIHLWSRDDEIRIEASAPGLTDQLWCLLQLWNICPCDSARSLMDSISALQNPQSDGF